jgi:hypothetical protein
LQLRFFGRLHLKIAREADGEQGHGDPTRGASVERSSFRRRFMRSDGLGVLDGAAFFQVGGDAGGAAMLSVER